MRLSGSVLIVVLGLLAILTIVGITFITMSSLDRSTSANFAVQSQFVLAADGAVDYVCYTLVQDLWQYDSTTRSFKDRLLTDANSTAPGSGLIRNEGYDFPGTEDPWLATAVDVEDLPAPTAQPPGQRSFDTTTLGAKPPFGLTDWGYKFGKSGEFPNNLGFPTSSGEVDMYTTGDGHGVWIPELSFPFETGLIRVSVTVQDHAAMVNLNAHGNTLPNPQTFRFGYFVSDVDPSVTITGKPSLSFNMNNLLNGTGKFPGLWKEADKPGNINLMAAVIENPGKFGDRIFTLDEEFELRRLKGTFFTSRLEQFTNNSLLSDPETGVDRPAIIRASCTTVGWTSLFRPDTQDTKAAQTGLPTMTPPYYQPRKVDLNTDSFEAIRDALKDGYVFKDTAVEVIDQVAANICAFRTRESAKHHGIKKYGKGRTGPVGASRQPIFSKVKATSSPAQGGGKDWTIDVQLVSPWPGNFGADTDRLYTNPPGAAGDKMTLSAPVGVFTPAELPDQMPSEATAGTPSPIKHTLTILNQSQPLSTALKYIRLMCNGKIIDEIEEGDIKELETGGNLHRTIAIELEKRFDTDSAPVRVLYLGGWLSGLNGTINDFTPKTKPDHAVPIRFPRTVEFPTTGGPAVPASVPEKGLPPFLASFMKTENGQTIQYCKAFARLGDLNQVLCPKDKADVDEFWPWTIRVAKSSTVETEKNLKFNWQDTDPPGASTPSRLNAAAVFTTGGPWNDKIDNDGDGYADEGGAAGFYGADDGAESRGQFGGPEARVAGLINLNTATRTTLETLEVSFNLPANILVNAVLTRRPLKSPAQILESVTAAADKPDDEARGDLENRDLMYTRISNIATVRSDTFSVYGTVQYIDTTLMFNAGSSKPDRERAVRATRRFWALIDRSPSLAYYPVSNDFIRPRVLNFQWLE
ncbi:MAG: pilus assembly PilX N-terminal domain-containing protein [Planctomycetes bacterium]|nr:pilus assembly PilX N-terminal domain-containing protein [Planctomycetota bacterium]